MSMTTLPPGPTRTNPGAFAAAADALVAALPQFVTDANALQADVTTRQSDVTTRQADVVTRQADVITRQADVLTRQADVQNNQSLAAASAASALNAPGTSATSTTNLTIALGVQNLTIQTGKSLSNGQTVLLAMTATPSVQMIGTLNSYNSVTGALQINVTFVSGSGSSTAWTVSLSGPQGPAALPLLVRVPRTANTILASADSGKWFNATTGGFTQTLTAAATLGAGWGCWYTNSSSSNVTFTPASGNIDGAASGTLKPGMSIVISCDGSNFNCERVGPRVREVLTSGTSGTTALGVRFLDVITEGAGGGGGSGASGQTYCVGGCGGAARKLFQVSPNTAYTYVVGAFGVGGTTSGSSGSSGGTSSFTIGGVTISATGGAGAAAASQSSTIALGGVGSGGDINETGSPGQLNQSAGFAFGGPSPFGLGSSGYGATLGGIVAPSGYGAGGCGGGNNGTQIAGSNGTSGVNILEY